MYNFISNQQQTGAAESCRGCEIEAFIAISYSNYNLNSIELLQKKNVILGQVHFYLNYLPSPEYNIDRYLHHEVYMGIV